MRCTEISARIRNQFLNNKSEPFQYRKAFVTFVNEMQKAILTNYKTGSKTIFFVLFLLISASALAQDNTSQKTLLDSLNKERENDRGVFNLYIKKPEIEIIAGAFRNRDYATQGFEPFNLTYHVYLPFQFDLNYVNVKAREKLLKINANFIIHHSKYGNYALGLGTRFSFLIFKKTYISYQAGLVWCEPVKSNTNDGINNMGFCLHHEFSISYYPSKHIKTSANIIHLSNGGIFKGVENNQDVIGLGIAYLF